MRRGGQGWASRPSRCGTGAAQRPGERAWGPSGAATLAKHLGRLNLRDWEVGVNGALRAVAQAGVGGAKVPGLVEGPDRAPPQRDIGCGQVTRTVRIADQRGRVHALEVPVDGWKVRLRIESVTKLPRGVHVGKIAAHETHGPRALVTPARAKRGGAARRHTGVFAQGFGDGPALWWRDQQGGLCVVPAPATMAVTADARAQAAAGAGLTVGRRVPPGRHGQGKGARPERREAEVVGSTGLTTAAPDGTAAQGRDANRRACEANPRNAGGGRQWHGRDDGPWGKPVCLTNASGQQPWRPFAAEAARRLIAIGGLKDPTPPGDLGHPPQNTERAVRVPGVCTLLMCARAPA
jgi:hypothetical protein